MPDSPPPMAPPAGHRGTLLKVLEDPQRIPTKLLGWSGHFYNRELPVRRADVVTILPPILDTTPVDVVDTWNEIAEIPLATDISDSFGKTRERPSTLHSNWRELLYVLVRHLAPSTVVETGIFDGLSSAYILEALNQNGEGQLVSIDINDRERYPSDLDAIDAGWAVPHRLRVRWDRRFGDANDVLPDVFDDVTPELFLHDSLHTESQMQAELHAATDVMEPGGVVMTDNSQFNDVFQQLEDRFDATVYWKNTDYARAPDGRLVDDRLGIGRL